ncbi:putative undecaprenyl-phosphate N-acetylglucosaminyl 1-phosphate transferase [Paraburkholderia caffeinitolerans]|uniref:Putative undecaprenyl-phosphate N-acetylglucosaminyl 1-phosphate transferase n=2 Tax=Paraburkholderia caffeinitolerans TaxID=1723730 RepID=A0A6J5FBN8_9BURK|nr:glycosyltransferase family 4 protein [Paraburkholderia caffeinitolerans]CAB3776412.1 putative undecaprenyl-phosphate N-acetylglucosaminyl 1-phosphate transferase [Paraburkholderia caffeinitolerans]
MDPRWIFIIVAVAGLVASVAILRFLLATGLAWRLATDIPNDRSLHSKPVPRVGGWAIVPVVCVSIWIVAPGLWLAAVLALALAVLSQIDDRRGLPARVRFAAHIAAATVFVAATPGAVPVWVLFVLGILLVWLVNLYNFMDGSDGLAGGMALFGFSGYALAAGFGPHPDTQLALAATAVAAAAAGFLFLNFHPARVFLGDAGSIPLGFLAGALGYWGWMKSVWPIWFPALIFLPFIADASVTLVKRVLRREKVWLPHKEHYYQRMVRLGMGHAATARAWYLVMAVGVVIATFALGLKPVMQWVVAGAWSVILLFAGVCIDRRWQQYQGRMDNAKVIRK